jgi:hypothetical protein
VSAGFLGERTMKTEPPSFTEQTIITAAAMNTLCIEDVLVALRLFIRRRSGHCPDFALTCDRNRSSFWISREPDGSITVYLQSER